MTNPIPYTNEFGQVIEVGQKVAYVTYRTRARQKQGKYVGLSPSGGVTIEITRDNFRWVNAEEVYVPPPNSYAGQTVLIKGVLKKLVNTPYQAKTVLQNNFVFPL